MGGHESGSRWVNQWRAERQMREQWVEPDVVKSNSPTTSHCGYC